MTAISTTWRRLWSAFVDHKLLSEPTGSLYAVKGMTREQMRQLQRLAPGPGASLTIKGDIT